MKTTHPLLLCLLLLLLFNCEDEITSEPATILKVETLEPDNITPNSAVLRGRVEGDTSIVLGVGFLVNGKFREANGLSADNTYSLHVYDVKGSTTYSEQAVAITQKDTVKGEIKTLTTPDGGKWLSKLVFAGQPRYSAVGFSLNDKIYIGGGHQHFALGSHDSTHYLSDFWQYNPELNQWKKVSDLPSKAFGMATFSINGRGFIVCGEKGQANNNLIYTNEVWEYVHALNIWVKRKPFPGTPRADALSFSIKSKGYIFGGQSSVNGNIVNHKDLWEYDPETDSWLQKNELPMNWSKYTYWDGQTTFSADRYAYILQSVSKDFWRYDPELDAWNNLKSFEGRPSTFGAGFVVNNDVYFKIGSLSDVTIGPGPFFSADFWKYDVGSNDWVLMENVPWGAEISNLSGFTAGNKGYLMLGHSLSSRLFYSSNGNSEYTVPVK